MKPDQAVIDRWVRAAPFWEKYRDIVWQMFAPVGQALIADAQISSGHAVLDVATGPGEPALTVAPLVGPEGKVVGIDPIPPMVAAARRAAEQRGLGNTQFEVAAADDLPFPSDRFDAVISRFGAMFFPRPVDAVREMVRVLRPGGKLALAVWDLEERNPFFITLSRIIERYVDLPRPGPDDLDTFRFGPTGKLRDVVSEAGVPAPSERLLRFAIEAPISAEEFWTFRYEMSETVREKLAPLSPEQLIEVQRQAIEAFREYSTGGGISFPAQVLIVSGTKRGSA